MEKREKSYRKSNSIFIPNEYTGINSLTFHCEQMQAFDGCDSEYHLGLVRFCFPCTPHKPATAMNQSRFHDFACFLRHPKTKILPENHVHTLVEKQKLVFATSTARNI